MPKYTHKRGSDHNPEPLYIFQSNPDHNKASSVPAENRYSPLDQANTPNSLPQNSIRSRPELAEGIRQQPAPLQTGVHC